MSEHGSQGTHSMVGLEEKEMTEVSLRGTTPNVGKASHRPYLSVYFNAVFVFVLVCICV